MLNGSAYSIKCRFITGSDARGCVYTLVGVEGVENITGTIERTNSEGVVINDATCFREILAYDWENDNSTGSVSIMRDTSSLLGCPTSSGK